MKIARTVGVLILLVATSDASKPFELRQGDVVTFLGGTNLLHLQQSGHLETMLTGAFPAAHAKFRDLSWEGDTVFRLGTVIERWRPDGFGERDEQLKRVGTTVVFAQFGQLESMAGEEGIADFVKSYSELIDAIQRQARTVVLISPTRFEVTSSPLIPNVSNHNPTLKSYVEAISRLAKTRGLFFVDLFSGVNQLHTENGMHIKPTHQKDIAERILDQLNLGNSAPRPVDGSSDVNSDYETLRQAVVEKHRLWYDYWRPANWKLLYGDDSKRQFTRGGANYIPFREEWKKLIPLIDEAERRIWKIANGGPDVGHRRPAPEVLHGDASADIDKELAAFTVPEGWQVNLFASEKEGLTSPLAIRWDPAGRMYVTVTTTYPHVFPGDLPNDKIIVLEDLDQDGTADKSTVFAEGLNIPTGLELGNGGVYVGQNTELLFLKDTDGDQISDRREVVLGGFGNGDSHQTINSFIWSHGGELFFGQGDGCESRVETPWGSSDLFQAGFFRFRPKRLQLHPLLDDFMGPGNPWGVAFNKWGQIFSIDGAGGVTFLSPGQVPTSHRQRLRTIGEPGGYCGIAYLDGRHLPKSMHGEFLLGDYKSNRVKRFSVEQEGAGFSLRWQDPILQSRHRNFRPVDVRVGPDGAVYVVDWYNPVTCHQDDAYRDPTRDKAHGRIWRISSGAPKVQAPNLENVSILELLTALTAPEYWTRYQAKRAMTTHDPSKVATALRSWVRTLDAQRPNYEQHLLNALGAYATIEVVEPVLLRRLLRAQQPQARAYATRMVGRWHDRLPDPLALLAEQVIDEHPLVRMEAVIACSAVPSAPSIGVAAKVVDFHQDEWIKYAFQQTSHHLKPFWLPALHRGELEFSKPNHLAAVLNQAGGPELLGNLKSLVDSDELSSTVKQSAIAAILAVGGPEDLSHYGLDPKRFVVDNQYLTQDHARTLAHMVRIARFRNVRPAGQLANRLQFLLRRDDVEIRTHAIRLAGIWKVKETREGIWQAAIDESHPRSVRSAAFQAVIELEHPEASDLLKRLSSDCDDVALRVAAIQALTNIDAQIAARQAARLLSNDQVDAPISAVLSTFLDQVGGSDDLASELVARPLAPKTAKKILAALFALGRSDQTLVNTLIQSIAADAKTPDFSNDLVGQIATSSGGSAERGALLFKGLACNSCHKIGGLGGSTGPDLSSLGTTLSRERIVEELMWPNRQVKEGYSMVQVVTKRGKIVQGLERTTRDSQSSTDVVIQDLASLDLVTIKKEDVEEVRNVGSPMPTGLTALLSHDQLLDLVQYLSDLGKIK